MFNSIVSFVSFGCWYITCLYWVGPPLSLNDALGTDRGYVCHKVVLLFVWVFYVSFFIMSFFLLNEFSTRNFKGKLKLTAQVS